MLETYFSVTKMLGRLRSGPSGPYLDGFAAALKRQGYSPATAVRYLRAAAHLGHVMAEHGLANIDVAAFGDHLRTCRCSRGEWRASQPPHYFSAPGFFASTSSRPYLIGWRSYFGFCQTPRVLTNLEAWTRRRLRSYLWRQWGNGHNRYKELRRRGVPKFSAAAAAGSPTGLWRMSGHPAVQQALRNHYFEALGLPRLLVPAQA